MLTSITISPYGPSSFDMGAPMTIRLIAFVWQGQRFSDSYHEPYTHPIYVCRTAPFHHNNATSPRQNQLTCRCHFLQVIHQIILPCSIGTATAHPDPSNLTPSNSTSATLASPPICPVHKRVIPHRDQVFHCFCRTQHVHPLPPTGHTAT